MEIFLTALIITLAVAYVGRHLYRTLAKGAASGTCGKCGCGGKKRLKS